MRHADAILIASFLATFVACDIGGGGSSTVVPTTDPGASGTDDQILVGPDLASPVDTAVPVEDPGMPTADSGAQTCGASPVLHPSVTKGPYCPYQEDGATSSSCALGQHCCQYGPGSGKKSTCNDAGVPCDADINAFGVDWECDDTGDCQDRGLCCLQGAVEVNQACNYMAGSGVIRTYCSQACASGRPQICSSAVDCGVRSCEPFKAFTAKDLGYCF